MTAEIQRLSDTLPAFLSGSSINFDFNEIKKDLKNFLKNQEQFSDYNFEASGISLILDILAYNAQMNAMTTHLGLNEVFLHSAQARPNIVSSANLLSYLPQSNSSASAVVDVEIISFDNFTLNNFLEIPKGTIFTGGNYTWVLDNSVIAEKVDGKFKFFDLLIKEGVYKIVKYFFDSTIDYQRFEIPDSDVDISSLVVNVKESEQSSFIQPYFRFSSFSEITETSPVYFIQENSIGRYEIYFLSNGVGIHPSHGSVVEMSYRRTAGDKANGTSIFIMSSVPGVSNEKSHTVTKSRAHGGSNKEGKESIRHNAPYQFQAQNRCVTANDYISVIKENLPGVVESITAWGGEKSFPPEYGRMFIAIKPFGGDALSSNQKEYIVNNIIKPKNVATISPEIVDPEFVWVGIDIIAKYDENRTTNTAQKIEELISNTIISFGDSSIHKFGGSLKHSKLLSAIDNTELSIVNSAARVYLIKAVKPLVGIANQFLVQIPAELYNQNKQESLIQTTPIKIGGKLHYLEDTPLPNDQFRRKIQLIHYDTVGNRRVILDSVGVMNFLEKNIFLSNIKPDTNEPIKLYFEPNSYDISPFQNQFLRIDFSEISIRVEPDSADRYSLAPRSRK